MGDGSGGTGLWTDPPPEQGVLDNEDLTDTSPQNRECSSVKIELQTLEPNAIKFLFLLNLAL